MSEDRVARFRRGLSRRALLSTGAVAGLGGLAGCSADGSSGADDKLKEKIDNPPDILNKTDFPIVDKPIKLQFMTGRDPKNAKDYNHVANWAKYQKMTNTRISWGLVPGNDVEEKRNLALSGDDYPEVFNSMAFGVRDIGKYGNQGTFIKLNDLIDNYAPNLKKLMEKYPEVRRGMTFPDGEIHGLPTIRDPDFLGLKIPTKLFIRGDWLDKFDMNVPATTDEYYRYLKAIKTKRPNGKSDSVGYGNRGGTGDPGINLLIETLSGSFGVGNRGFAQGYLDVDPGSDHTVRFYRISDGYKALLEYLHKLYSQGLILKNIFSIDISKAWNAAAKGMYGSIIDQAPDPHFNAKNFVPTPALKGPDGDHTYNQVSPSLTGLGGFVITEKCKHPLVAMRWMDYFYSDTGAKLFFMGVEGKSYKETKDGVEYLDKIRNPKDGKTTDEAKAPYVTYMGGRYAGLIKGDYFKGVETSKQSAEAANLLKPDMQKTIWPAFTYTQDESERLDSMADDIEKYVDESTDKFINGDLRVSDWDKYVNKIKEMGLDDYMEIQQAACDRYRKA